MTKQANERTSGLVLLSQFLTVLNQHAACVRESRGSSRDIKISGLAYVCAFKGYPVCARMMQNLERHKNMIRRNAFPKLFTRFGPR